MDKPELADALEKALPLLDGLETGREYEEYAFATAKGFQAMTYCPEAFEALRVLPEAIAALRQHNAVQAEAGYQVSGSVYEAAVEGRQAFRSAYRELLPVLRAAEHLSRLWRTNGQKINDDTFLNAINAVDVAVSGGNAKPQYISERHPTPQDPVSVTGDVERLLVAAREAVNGASRTYTKANGQIGSIEADDGEACDILHSDLIYQLQFAVEKLEAQQALSTNDKGGER